MITTQLTLRRKHAIADVVHPERNAVKATLRDIEPLKVAFTDLVRAGR
jgi:hypothetical protein